MKSIFISSTFKDMQAERDMIQRLVYPRVREIAAKYGENIGMIDLRWGIDTTDLNEEESSKQILTVCLDRINASKPYIIVLLGERYGWIPGPGVTIKNAGKNLPAEAIYGSITELEIQCGALADNNPNALFYFRSPLDTESLPDEKVDIFKAESEEHSRRLDYLKRKIKTQHPDRVREYSLEWNKSNQTFSGLDNLGELIVEDLTKLLEEEFGKAEKLSLQERSILNTWRLIKEKAIGFSARQNTLKDILARLKKGGQIIYVKGESGSGKSTLASKIALDLNKEGFEVVPFLSGSDAKSRTALDVIKHQINQLESVIGINRNESAEQENQFLRFEDYRKRLEELINLFSSKEDRNLVLLVDAINQLNAEGYRDNLLFLPKSLPEKVSVLLTATSSFEIPNTVIEKPEFTSYEINPLTKEEARKIIESFLQSHSKDVSESIKNTILSKNGVNNALYLNLLLQRLDLFDAEDFNEIKEAGDDMNAINSFINGLINKAPEELQEMSVWFLNEMVERSMPKNGMDLMKLLAVSRNGLRELDLEKLAVQRGFEWSTLKFSQLKSLLSDFLSEREDGRIDFTHPVFREGILNALSQEEILNINQSILDWFTLLPYNDPVKIQEHFYHSMVADKPETAVDYIQELYSINDRKVIRIFSFYTGSMLNPDNSVSNNVKIQIIDILTTIFPEN